MPDLTLHDLALRLRRFAAERGWNAIDTPRNLALAVLVEAAELQEHFQWLSEEESARLPADKLESVSLEMADVLIFLLRLSDTLGIDAAAAAQHKITINARKYPADKAHGRATKYNEL